MEKFAFIIHPLDVKRDAAKKYPPLRFASVGMVEGLMKRMSPKLMSHITGVRSETGAEAEGWLIGCPLSAAPVPRAADEFVY
jgi:hypothetical protein